MCVDSLVLNLLASPPPLDVLGCCEGVGRRRYRICCCHLWFGVFSINPHRISCAFHCFTFWIDHGSKKKTFNKARIVSHYLTLFIMCLVHADTTAFRACNSYLRVCCCFDGVTGCCVSLLRCLFPPSLYVDTVTSLILSALYFNDI